MTWLQRSLIVAARFLAPCSFTDFRRPALAVRISPAGWGLLPGAPALTRTRLSLARRTRLSGRTMVTNSTNRYECKSIRSSIYWRQSCAITVWLFHAFLCFFFYLFVLRRASGILFRAIGGPQDMLGAHIGEERGKVTGFRVLDAAGPTVEVSITTQGRTPGSDYQGRATYTSEMQPSGYLFGEG